MLWTPEFVDASVFQFMFSCRRKDSVSISSLGGKRIQHLMMEVRACGHVNENVNMSNEHSYASVGSCLVRKVLV